MSKKILEEIKSEHKLSEIHLDAQFQSDPSLLESAVKNGADEILKLLISYGGNVNAYVVKSRGISLSLVHLAIKETKVSTLRLLLDEGANPNSPGILMNETEPSSPTFPLHYAQRLYKNPKNSEEQRKLYQEMIDLITAKIENRRIENRIRLPPPSFPPPPLPHEALSRHQPAPGPVSPKTPFIKPSILVMPKMDVAKGNYVKMSTSAQPLPMNQENNSPIEATAPIYDLVKRTPQQKLEFLKERLQIALDLQEDLSKLENQLSELAKSFERDISAIKTAFEAKETVIKAEIRKVRNNPGFQEDFQIQRITDEMEKVTNHVAKESKPQNSSVKLLRPSDNNFKYCPICFETPKEVYCCQVCDNMVCGICKMQLKSCAMCRQDFNEKPLQRNKLAERLLNEN